MTPRLRIAALVIAIPGLLGCLAATTWFVVRILRNELGWHPNLPAREHYQAVGTSYSEGFATGFFLCLFLVLMGAALAGWRERRRRRVS